VLGCSAKNRDREKISHRPFAEGNSRQRRCRVFGCLCRDFQALDKAWISSSDDPVVVRWVDMEIEDKLCKIVIYVPELSIEPYFRLRTTKTFIFLLELFESANFRPCCDVTSRVSMPRQPHQLVV
jgi:hypothetical protein